MNNNHPKWSKYPLRPNLYVTSINPVNCARNLSDTILRSSIVSVLQLLVIKYRWNLVKGRTPAGSWPLSLSKENYFRLFNVQDVPGLPKPLPYESVTYYIGYLTNNEVYLQALAKAFLEEFEFRFNKKHSGQNLFNRMYPDLIKLNLQDVRIPEIKSGSCSSFMSRISHGVNITQSSVSSETIAVTYQGYPCDFFSFPDEYKQKACLIPDISPSRGGIIEEFNALESASGFNSPVLPLYFLLNKGYKGEWTRREVPNWISRYMDSRGFSIINKSSNSEWVKFGFCTDSIEKKSSTMVDYSAPIFQRYLNRFQIQIPTEIEGIDIDVGT